MIWPNLNVSFYLWRLLNEINLHWPFSVYSMSTYGEISMTVFISLCWLVFTVEGKILLALWNTDQWKGRVVEVCEKVFKKEAMGVLKQNWAIWRFFVCLCACVCMHTCVLKVYIQYIHSCLCWVDCFITLMKHSYTGCQMCSPVSIGEMSPCPRLKFFHQKRKWKHTLLACWGREGLGRLLEEVREKREREREWRTQGCSHLDLLYGHFHWTKSGGDQNVGSFWIYW